jgi:hypothetical protein
MASTGNGLFCRGLPGRKGGFVSLESAYIYFSQKKKIFVFLKPFRGNLVKWRNSEYPCGL